ncbi:hypothetical protein ACTXT7_014982 [Hymenolepis weldensis]
MSHVGRSARKKVFVQSRYRSTSVSKVTVSASSPRRDTLPSFSISDSVASSIPSRKMNTSLPSRTASKHSPFLSDEDLIKWSNQTMWKFLVLKSRKALESQVYLEVNLRKTIMEKRRSDAWFKKWLVSQKSLDEQIEIYKKLVALLEGDKGVINLLRRFHDHHLEPVSNRLPVYEIAIGDDLITNLKYAFEAQNQARYRSLSRIKVCLEQQQKGLGRLSQQMSDLARVVQTSTAWTANREDVLSKLTEASRLLLHLASLHAHRRQLEMTEKLDYLL